MKLYLIQDEITIIKNLLQSVIFNLNKLYLLQGAYVRVYLVTDLLSE